MATWEARTRARRIIERKAAEIEAELPKVDPDSPDYLVIARMARGLRRLAKRVQGKQKTATLPILRVYKSEE